VITAVSTIAFAAMAVIALRRAGDVIPAAGAVQFTFAPPENTSFGGPPGNGSGIATQVAVSPDGRNVVFVARAQSDYSDAARYQIWLRSVASLDARPIPGTEGGTFPFWSPDNRFIGFFAAGKLKKVQIAGGPPMVLCDAPVGRGGTWSRDNVILFTSSNSGGVLRVSSNGGAPVVVTTVDPAHETSHRWPHFLPDGRHFLYTATSGTCCPPSKPGVIRMASLDPAEAVMTLFEADSPVLYAAGHLFFASRDESLMAQAFDLEARRTTGDAFPLAEHVSFGGTRYVGASVSQEGTLVYARSDAQAAVQLTWFDRGGRTLATLGDAAPYLDIALSPDERRVAVGLATGTPANTDIWTFDIARNVPSRLTFDPGFDASPVWSPDGTRIAFLGNRSGKVSLRQQSITQTATDESLFDASGLYQISPSNWSADGRFIAYTSTESGTSDVWILPLSGDRKPFPLVQTRFTETAAVFSPDVRWIAYTTNESGQFNVVVQPFPGTGGKNQVSTNGGSQPVWRADGKELFYVGADGTIMAVPIDATGQVTGVAQALFRTSTRVGPVGTNQTFAVTKDGQRFLVGTTPQQPRAASITVVVNWTAGIQK
jgi:Tol biopolymer transport system component